MSFHPTQSILTWAGKDMVGCIELRRGVLRETLNGNLPTIDLLFLDSEHAASITDSATIVLNRRAVWTPMAFPTLKSSNQTSVAVRSS